MHKSTLLGFMERVVWSGQRIRLALCGSKSSRCVTCSEVTADKIKSAEAALQVSLAGILVSAFVLLLGLTKSVIVINNVVPQSVVRGMQLGLGLSLARRGLALVVDGEVERR